MKQDLIDIISEIQGTKILVLGDMVADIYLHGTISRISREAPVLVLGPSALLHRRGSPEIRIGLGELTDSNGKSWPSREALVTWNAEDITLDRLDALPGVGLRKLVARLPAAGEPA